MSKMDLLWKRAVFPVLLVAERSWTDKRNGPEFHCGQPELLPQRCIPLGSRTK